MRRIFKELLGLLIGFSMISGGVSFVYAQETGTEEFTLEEITVTAQKREENQQKVAIAMEVITGEDLKDLGKTDLVQILSTISNATIQKAQDGLRVSIRGMADNTDAGSNQVSAAPTVAVNIDGVTSNRKDTGSGLYDLERVEVLYGPQSTLYATNSPGGIVNVVTAAPKLDKFEVAGTLEIGDYSLLHTEGVVNVPINETIGLRASFSTNKRDGYLSNGGDNEDTKSARLKGLFQPNDNLSIQVTAEYSKDGGSGFSGGVNPFIDESDVDDPWTGIEVGSLGYNDQKKQKYNANIQLNTRFATFTLVPSYTKSEGEREMIEATPMGTEQKTFWQDTYEKGAEMRIASSQDFFFKWLVGYIYYDSHDGNNDVSLAYQTTGVGSYRLRDIDEKITALYGNLTYPVTDQLRLNVGIRKGTDEFVQHGVQNTLQSDGSYLPVVRDQIMDSPSKPDWKFGLEYDLEENTMLYGSYATSYRVQSKYRSLAKPEELKSYSVGSKSRFMGNRLQLNTAAYYYDYLNFLARNMASVWVADLDGDLQMDMNETEDDSGAAGQGDGRMYGFDIQASAIITNNDKLDLAISYEKSEWTDLFFNFEHETQKAVVDGALVDVLVEDVSYNGKTMVFTPPWSITAAYSHNFLLGNGGSIKANLDVSFKSGYRLTWKEAEYPYNYQESHHIENLSAIYTHSNGMWTLTGYVKNLSNYAVKTMYRSDRGGFMSIGTPRTYGAVMSVKF